MALKVSALGENALLKDMLGVTTPGPLTIRLYTNDISPGDADVVSTFTQMATNGYAAKTLAPAVWSVTQATGVAEAIAPSQTWVFTAGTPVDIYGYYVVGADGILRWAERFSSVFTSEFLNDSVTVTPKFTLSTV